MRTSPNIAIYDLRERHENQWRALWKEYLAFYKVVVPEAATDKTWKKICGANSVFGLAALAGDRLVGFAVVLLQNSTWSVAKSAYLEDLFVAPAERGQGIGRALIDGLISKAHVNGWNRVYWHSHESNQRARFLYDSYVPADGFVRYRLEIM